MGRDSYADLSRPIARADRTELCGALEMDGDQGGWNMRGHDLVNERTAARSMPGLLLGAAMRTDICVVNDVLELIVSRDT